MARAEPARGRSPLDRLSVSEDSASRPICRKSTRPQHRSRPFLDGARRPRPTHRRPYPSRANRIDPGVGLLAREQPCQGIQGGLAWSVTSRRPLAHREDVIEGERRLLQLPSKRSRLTRKFPQAAGYHHHASTLGQLRRQSPGQQQRSTHVDGPNLPRRASINTGIVHQNIDRHLDSGGEIVNGG